MFLHLDLMRNVSRETKCGFTQFVCGSPFNPFFVFFCLGNMVHSIAFWPRPNNKCLPGTTGPTEMGCVASVLTGNQGGLQWRTTGWYKVMWTDLSNATAARLQSVGQDKQGACFRLRSNSPTRERNREINIKMCLYSSYDSQKKKETALIHFKVRHISTLLQETWKKGRAVALIYFCESLFFSAGKWSVWFFPFEDASVTICPVRSEELQLLTACARRLLWSAMRHSTFQARRD